MAAPGDSQDTGMLEMKSLQLDIIALQQSREEDKQEFLEFKQTVNKNFASIQTNFTSIQTNFERLFAARKGETLEQHAGNQDISTPETPPNMQGLSATSVRQQQAPLKQNAN